MLFSHNDSIPPLESVPHTTSVHPSEDSDPPVSESEGAAVNSKGSSMRWYMDFNYKN